MIRILATIAALALPTIAVASEPFLLDHNGSIMIATPEGDGFSIRYARPRDGLEKAGVTPGTLLFKGRLDGVIAEGTAYAFKSGCKPAAYRMMGQIHADGTLVLRGPGPKRSGCSYRLDPSSVHSRLEFTGDPSELAGLDAGNSGFRTGAEMATILDAAQAPEPARPVETPQALVTPEPVAVVAPRNEARPPVVVAEPEEMTEDQIEEATYERSIYPVPGQYTGPPIEGVEPAPEAAPAPVATIAETPAVVPAATPTPEPPKRKLDLDF